MLTRSGQQEARSRWGTQESGTAFDRKKRPFLSAEARQFLAEQTIAVLAGTGAQENLSGLLILGLPGFLCTPDEHTCLLPLELDLLATPLLQRIQTSAQPVHLALCVLDHTTRRRLCVQGYAALSFSNQMLAAQGEGTRPSSACLWLHVTQAFFHCPKYIRTRIPGLTLPPTEPKHHLEDLLVQGVYSAAFQDFLTHQMFCYLATINRDGHCAINHRGGNAGFLVSVPFSKTAPQGTILLPDYAGNGAFEAIGNILETGRVAFILPSYVDQLAISLSGTAYVIELSALSPRLREQCRGAERVVVLTVEHVEGQKGNWQAVIHCEQERATLTANTQREEQAMALSPCTVEPLYS
jgi:uncharacterized protein